VEYEFERITLSRQLSRNVVARLLTDRAEHGGWELDRLRMFPDGTRKVVLRRKIIRQTRPTFIAF
jgi:phage gp46-like protein